MASGDSRLYTGAYVATGTALTIAAPGFKPRYVQLVNVVDACTALHIEGMADDSALIVAAAAAYVATECITLTDTGFTVGVNALLNTDTETVHYVCGS